jgi:hypothetical protein
MNLHFLLRASILAGFALGAAGIPTAGAREARVPDFPWTQLRSSIGKLFEPAPRPRVRRKNPSTVAVPMPLPRPVEAMAPPAQQPVRREIAAVAKPENRLRPTLPPAAAKTPVPLPAPAPHRVVALTPAQQAAPPEPAANVAAPTVPTPEKPEVTVMPPMPSPPSACQLRLSPDVALAHPLPPIFGPGECVADDVVTLEAVVLRDGRKVAVLPAATLRCPMAEAVAHWIRDDVAAAVNDLGAPLRAIASEDSFNCRGRNHVANAKISEHGKANALDIRAFTLSDGKTVALTDRGVAEEFRERLRLSACNRFNTVLGPGSDGYHENHVHLDLAQRRSGYRMCQWDVHPPPQIVSVPMPPEKPATLTQPPR